MKSSIVLDQSRAIGADYKLRTNSPIDLRTSLMPGLNTSLWNVRSGLNHSMMTTTPQKGGTRKIIVCEFNPKDYIMPGVSEKDVEIYKEVFDLFSVSGTGLLTPMDLRNAMEAFGYHPKKSVVYEIVSEIDLDESGGIDFREFLNIVTGVNRNVQKDNQSSLKKVFKHYDQDNKGYCTKEDFKRTAIELGEKLQDETVDIIFKKMSPEDPEKLSFEAFCNFMRS